MTNPRYKNGNFRRKMRQRFIAQGAPCHICKGKLGPIDYTAPSDSAHPLSFVIDEIRPVSRWKEWGYESPSLCAQDPDNLAPAHRICNQAKSAKTLQEFLGQEKKTPHPSSGRLFIKDGDW